VKANQKKYLTFTLLGYDKKMEPHNGCPKCSSDELQVMNPNYPKAYECNKCKYSFIKGKNALIDDE